MKIKRKRGFLFEDFLKIPSLEENKDNPEQNNNKNQQQPQPAQQPQSTQKPPSNLPANLESIEQF